MSWQLFSEIVRILVRCKDCEERRTTIRVTVELHCTSNPVSKKDLIVRLTDDIDPLFLYNLIITEEDFQSLKHQQGLLIDFSAFPQKFIDLLQQCIQEASKDVPRFLLQLVSSAPLFDNTSAYLNVVETNPFKHLNHLSLKLLHGTDVEIKKYLASCLKCTKDEKLLLEQQLKKIKEDFTRQLACTQKALSEKSSELDRLRIEWTTQTATVNDQYSQELTTEREKLHQAQTQWQQQSEQQKEELETAHRRSLQQLQTSLAKLDTVNKELTERRYKAEYAIQEIKAKLLSLEDECHRAKQEVQSLHRENSMLDAECHEKDKLINQLQTRVAVLQQETKDKDQLVSRTKEVLEATQEQKLSFEENSEKKQVQVEQLEATVKSLSEELLKANKIIKKLQMDLKALMGKLKLKNTVTVQQEKLLSEKEKQLQKEQRELQDAQQALQLKGEEVSKLQEQFEGTMVKLEESKELLKTNENVITWLNKQINENQMVRKQEIIRTSGIVSASGCNGIFKRETVPSNISEKNPFLIISGTDYPVTSVVSSFPQQFTANSMKPRHAVSRERSLGPTVPISSQYLKSSTPSMASKPKLPMGLCTAPSSGKENKVGGLESKYFKQRQDSIPLRGLSAQITFGSEHQKSFPSRVGAQTMKSGLLPPASAYFRGQELEPS
ncbi:spindle assembly abnormal protein 6 homolog [Scyliorhinus canicula]|uniref:spindle assembly abnormal protein 6 homolog n=1 Tax=Scyliorhinus canicula TaxID=7830 RepID=UPI0018F3B08A|nr:spindle assembly abnormal protein 6 homolog [Scyliorhinus canicula]